MTQTGNLLDDRFDNSPAIVEACRAYRRNRDFLTPLYTAYPELGEFAKSRFAGIYTKKYKSPQLLAAVVMPSIDSVATLEGIALEDVAEWTCDNVGELCIHINADADALMIMRAITTQLNMWSSNSLAEMCRSSYCRLAKIESADYNYVDHSAGLLTATVFGWQRVVHSYYKYMQQGDIPTARLGIFAPHDNRAVARLESNFLGEWIRRELLNADKQPLAKLESVQWFTRASQHGSIEVCRDLLDLYNAGIQRIAKYIEERTPISMY
jgi:hypothetical protein